LPGLRRAARYAPHKRTVQPQPRLGAWPPKRERRSTQRLFEELRFDARFDSRILVHRRPVSPFGDGELPEMIIEQSHHDSFMSVPTSARFYIFGMSASLMMTTRPRRSGPARLENISR
jgi:hypothetical protein